LKDHTALDFLHTDLGERVMSGVEGSKSERREIEREGRQDKNERHRWREQEKWAERGGKESWRRKGGMEMEN
jgi:hypothetical protein